MSKAKRRGRRAAVAAAGGAVLIVCLAGGSAPFAAEPEPEPPGAPDRSQGDSTSSDFSGWSVPPVRWGGSLVTDMRMAQHGDESWRRQQLEIANLRVGSYIWQPWFAQVSGGVGLIYSKDHWSGGGAPAANQARDTSSIAVTGNAALALFPVSRFPFNAYVDVSDSRASGELVASDTTSKRFGLRQSYRPLAGNASYMASFDRSTLESAAFGRDIVDALAASMTHTADAQALSVAGSHTRNTRNNAGERAKLSYLTANHSYRPEPELAVDSFASASSSDFHLLSRGVPTDNQSQFVQANTFATWRPEEDSPLFVTGGGRLFRAVTSNNFVDSESLTLSGNVAATYALSRQTTVSGGATVTQVMSDAGNGLFTTQTATVNHIGDPLALWGFTYRWNAGGSVGNQSGATSGMQQNVGGRFAHDLTRDVMLGAGSQVSIKLGQSVSANFDTMTAHSETLSHTGSVSWRLAQGGATSAYVSLLGADSRTTGEHANDFQLINLQASGQVQFSRNSAATANFTVQGVRQSTGTTPSAGFEFNTSGSASYFHNRAFDVPRLRYSALYSINESQYKSRLQGDVNAPRERVNQSFEQRLDYTMGRVAMRLSLRVAEIEGRRDALAFFRMERAFGLF